MNTHVPCPFVSVKKIPAIEEMDCSPVGESIQAILLSGFASGGDVFLNESPERCHSLVKKKKIKQKKIFQKNGQLNDDFELTVPGPIINTGVLRSIVSLHIDQCT